MNNPNPAKKSQSAFWLLLTIILASVLVIPIVDTPKPVAAMGAPCPVGANLYNATIISAVLTYTDWVTHQNKTIDLVQHPNPTINLNYNIDNLSAFALTSNITIHTAAVSNSGNTLEGDIYDAGANGNFGYQGCMTNYEADTVYSGIQMQIVHPASLANSSEISENIGGSTIGVTIDWISQSPSSSSTTTSSSTGTSQLKIITEDMAGGSLTGFYAVLNNSAGGVLQTGSTPATFTLNDGQNYTVQVDNYGNCHFNHWVDTGSTQFWRYVILQGNTTYTAVIDCAANPASTTSSSSSASTTVTTVTTTVSDDSPTSTVSSSTSSTQSSSSSTISSSSSSSASSSSATSETSTITTSPAPEFPSGMLAAIMLVVLVGAVIVARMRVLRPTRISSA